MAAGAVTFYDSGYISLFEYSANSREWDDPTAGNLYWILATSGYTPNVTTHTTTNDVTNKIGTGVDGEPMAATNTGLTQSTVTTFFTAGANSAASTVSFSTGGPVNITAKYLICVQPITAGSYSGTTDKLLFYMDLNSGGSNLVSTNGDFIVVEPVAGGWFSITQP